MLTIVFLHNSEIKINLQYLVKNIIMLHGLFSIVDKAPKEARTHHKNINGKKTTQIPQVTIKVTTLCLCAFNFTVRHQKLDKDIL